MRNKSHKLSSDLHTHTHIHTHMHARAHTRPLHKQTNVKIIQTAARLLVAVTNTISIMALWHPGTQYCPLLSPVRWVFSYVSFYSALPSKRNCIFCCCCFCCVFFKNRLAACLRLFSVVYMVLFGDSLVSHQPVIFQPGITGAPHPTPLLFIK